MRAAAALADRHQEVRSAARGWQRASAISEATRLTIDAAYPDDRARLGPVFRVLVFAFTFLITNAMFGLMALVLMRALERAGGVLLLLFGALLVTATEIQIGPLRRREGGAEAATAFLALIYLTAGVAWIASDITNRVAINVTLAGIALLFGLCGVWWGYELFVAVAGAAAFVLLARGPFGQLWWMVLPVVLAPVLLRVSDRRALAPSHRRACQALAAIALVFLYLAVHVGGWDVAKTILTLEHWDSAPRLSFRPFFIVATALVPIVVLAWGVISRRRLLINLGLLGLLVSLMTVRRYVHVAPAWVVLLAGGAATIAIALALRRFLAGGSDHERYGFTAEPLFSDPERRHALELAAGLVSLAPDARSGAPPGDFKGGGGRSGGAGASGTF